MAQSASIRLLRVRGMVVDPGLKRFSRDTETGDRLYRRLGHFTPDEAID